MRIGFISDLHIDRHTELPEKYYLKILLDMILKQQLEMLVIGGDISNHFTKTLHFVEELQNQAEIPVHFIPGNHDFWEEKDAQKNTKEIYKMYKEHPQSLIEKPLQINEDYTLVGHPGWYNHAIYDKERFSPDEVEHGKFRWAYWQDKLRMDWEMSDRDVSKRFSQLIEKDLKQVTTDNIILQTHVVTIPEYTMPMPHRTFDFFNAFMATSDLKHVHKAYPITHQVMGHVHFRAKILRDETEFITNSLGYRREWRSNDLEQEIRKSLVIIEV